MFQIRGRTRWLCQDFLSELVNTYVTVNPFPIFGDFFSTRARLENFAGLPKKPFPKNQNFMA